jgi:hypothetical protein
MKDKELKLEETEASHTLGAAINLHPRFVLCAPYDKARAGRGGNLILFLFATE